MNTITPVQAAAWLLEHDRYLILTHRRPDGDTIGCAAGLCTALRERGKTAHILPNPDMTALYAGYVEGLLARPDFVPETVVTVDIAARGLFPDNAKEYLDRIDLAVDHHPSQEFFAARTCLEAERAACGEIVFDIVKRWGPVSKQAALPLYMAIATDCGCFVYSNTNARCHRAAAELMETGIDVFPVNRRHFREKTFQRLKLEGMLTAGVELFHGGETAVVALTLDMMERAGASQEDIDDVSAFVGQIAGVKIGVTLRELGPDETKLSVRTTPGSVNAGAVCAVLGGGGHAAAAGAAFAGGVADAKAAVLAAIEETRKNKT